MKKKILVLFVLILVLFSFSVACSKTNKYSITAPGDATAEVGTYFILADVEIIGTEGKMFAAVKVEDKDGNSVEIVGNQFMVTKLTDYIATYFYTVKDEVVASASQKIKAVESTGPNIIVENYDNTAKCGTYILPKIQIVDILGESITPHIRVTTDLDDTSKDIAVVDNVFNITEEGATHYIQITAENSRKKSTIKTLNVYVRGANELETCDRAEYLADWSAIHSDAFTFNDKPAYIKGGDGSFHFIKTGHNFNLGNPEIVMRNLTIKDWSNMTALSFWVYNNGSDSLDIVTLSGGTDKSILARNIVPEFWTKVTLSKAQFEALGGWQGNKYKLDEMKSFNIAFYNKSGNVNVFIDQIELHTENIPTVTYSQSTDFAATDLTTEYTILQPTITGIDNPAITYNVFKDGSAVNIIGGNRLLLSNVGTFAVIATIKGTGGVECQASYLLTAAKIEPNTFITNAEVPNSSHPTSEAKLADCFIMLKSGGWGADNQRYEFNTYKQDISNYDYMSFKVKFTSDVIEILKLNLASGFDGAKTAVSVIADGKEHNIVVKLSDIYAESTTAPKFSIGLDCFGSNSRVTGEVFVKDFLLFKNTEIANIVYSDYALTIETNQAYTLPTVTNIGVTNIVTLRKSDGSVVVTAGATHTFTESDLYNIEIKTIVGAGTEAKEYFKSYTLIVTDPDTQVDLDDVSILNYINCSGSNNTSSEYLNGEDSTKSIKVVMGWGAKYPTIGITGNLTGMTTISFDVFAVPVNEGPEFHFSNMATGAALTSEKVALNSWVRVTLNIASMSGNAIGVMKTDDLIGMEYHLYLDNIVIA